MSNLEVAIIVALAIIAASLLGLVSILDKWTKQLSNISDRLLDIDRTLNNRR